MKKFFVNLIIFCGLFKDVEVKKSHIFKSLENKILVKKKVNIECFAFVISHSIPYNC